MKNIIITGGTSGIGAAIAKLLGEVHNTYVFDIKKPDFTDKYRLVDVCDGKALEDALEAVGNVDVLVNAAGIYIPQELIDMSDEQINKQIAVNLVGTALANKYALGHMENGGVIINISSGLGIAPEPESPVYCASKAGINMLTKALAQRYAEKQIRVNAILPGPVDTPMLRDAFSSKKTFEAYATKNPLGRVGQPNEVAKLVEYLISDDASYITGACIAIDGGESSSSLYSR